MTYSLYYNQLQMNKERERVERKMKLNAFFLRSTLLSRVPHKIYNVTIETNLS